MELRVATSELGAGLDALEAALRAERLPEATILELRLVAEELLTNLAKYGYDDGAAHWARVGLTLAAGDVILEFTDDGRPFDPLAAPPPEFSAQAGERPAGGLGVHLVRSLVDAAEYVRRGSQNVLTLRKRAGRGS
jgi:serine/threonine-protein kinase RsbW